MLTVWEQYIFIETMNVMKYSATDTKKQKKKTLRKMQFHV